MSTDVCLEIPDLWPTDVTLPDVLSPATLLRYQAGQLRAKTRNLLEAEIETVPGENEVTIEFYVVAPALDRYRYLLFSVRHRPDLVYPATIVAECFRNLPQLEYEWPEADGQQQFTKLVGQVLSSRETRSVIHSLVAKSNEVKASSPAA
jgi:hypothetical protein